MLSGYLEWANNQNIETLFIIFINFDQFLWIPVWTVISKKVNSRNRAKRRLFLAQNIFENSKLNISTTKKDFF